MSDMNFPSSPSDGDEYRKWVYDASSSSWVVVGVGVGGFDSNSVIELVDSDFVNSLVDFPDTQVLNNTDSLAEGITNLYYTTARQDSDTLFQVDSAYVQARQEVTIDASGSANDF
jgi:hypothetical protein